MVELLFVIALATVPLLIGWTLARSRPDWSNRKVSIVSAIPLTGLMTLVSLLALADAELSGHPLCDATGCGTAVIVGLNFAGFAGFGFLFGTAVAYAGVRIARRGKIKSSAADTFK